MEKILLYSLSLITLLALSTAGSSLAAQSSLSSNQQKFVSLISKEATAINQDIEKLRGTMLAMHEKVKKGEKLKSHDETTLKKVMTKYRAKPFNYNIANNWVPLLQKVDIIPISMVVAQAANESAWGNSRFAVQAKNLFGHSCRTPNCGIVPKNRKKGDQHQVKRFASHKESIKSYMHNLNTSHHYQKMRDMRWNKRQKNEKISGLHLADGIESYSELGQGYIKMIKELITTKDFARFDT